MSYCYEKGIPHSEFLGWPAEDRAKLMAYMLEKGERCQMCGTAGWEWEDDRFAYSPVTETCPGCQRMDNYRDGLKEKQPGQSVVMVPKEQAARLRSQQS